MDRECMFAPGFRGDLAWWFLGSLPIKVSITATQDKRMQNRINSRAVLLQSRQRVGQNHLAQQVVSAAKTESEAVSA